MSSSISVETTAAPSKPKPRSSSSAMTKRVKRLYGMLRFIAPYSPGLASAAVSHLVSGPPHKSWDLRMTLLMKFLSSYMDGQTAKLTESMEGDGDAVRRLERAQKSMNRPMPLPPHIVQKYVEIPRLERVQDELRRILGSEVVDAQSHSGTVPGEWVCHPDVSPDTKKTILFLHGGAYLFGSADGSHRWLTPRLSKLAGVQVLGLNYRLSPQAVFPAALLDALSAYLHLTDELGIPPSEITILGDSAGGNLSLVTCIALHELYPDKVPGNLVLLSPWCDLTHSLPVKTRGDYLPAMGDRPGKQGATSVPRLYCPKGELLKHRLVSPLFAPKLALIFPTTRVLLQVGAAERLFGEDLWMGQRLAEANPSGTVRVEIYEVRSSRQKDL